MKPPKQYKDGIPPRQPERTVLGPGVAKAAAQNRAAGFVNKTENALKSLGSLTKK